MVDVSKDDTDSKKSILHCFSIDDMGRFLIVADSFLSYTVEYLILSRFKKLWMSSTMVEVKLLRDSEILKV